MDMLVLILQYLPIVLIISIPLIIALYHSMFTSLKSPIHFQQGIESISPGRSALAQSVITISPLICILPLVSVSQLSFYSVGYIISVLLSAFLAASVLHYIPSPSICQYMQLRYHSNFLRLFIVTIEAVMLLIICLMFLTYSTLYTNELMKLLLPDSYSSQWSPLIISIVCCAIALLSALSVLFSGQSTLSQCIFYCPLPIIFIGCLLLLYYGMLNDSVILNELNMFQSIFIASNWGIFSLGLINGLHLIIAEPLLYQQYFSLNTKQQLRCSLLLHSVIFFVLLLSVISIKCLLLSSHSDDDSFLISCTHKDIFQQIITNTKNILLINGILNHVYSIFIVVFTSVLINCALSLTLVALTSFVWEELIRCKFYTSNQRRQLLIVQLILIVITILATISAIAFIHHYEQYFVKFVQLALLSLSIVAAPITATFLCSFIFPFNNSKGAFTGLLFGYLMTAILVIIRSHHSVISIEALSDCYGNSTTDMTTNNIIGSERTTMENMYYDGDDVYNTTFISMMDADNNNNINNLHGHAIDDDQYTQYENGNSYINTGENTISYKLKDPEKIAKNSFASFVKHVPFTLYPLIGFAATFFVMILISLISGGEDILSINLNLLMWPSFTNVTVRSNSGKLMTDHSRRAFVECESFRYAQQTSYPDTKYSRVRMDDANTIIENANIKRSS